ncbi:RNA polymerase sigma factor [bacterium]|nr:RNA polymerase sigma factor [bacterium]
MARKREHIYSELLVLRAQGGSRDAFRELVELWQGRLLGHAVTLLKGEQDAAQDAVQEAWVAAVRGLRRLDDPARFPSWIFRIVSNKCADEIRRRQRNRRAQERLEEEGPAVEKAPEPFDAPDEDALLAEGLAALPAERRAILRLHYVDGLSMAQIGEVLGIPAGTVKSRLFHAREELRKAVNRLGRGTT